MSILPIFRFRFHTFYCAAVLIALLIVLNSASVWAATMPPTANVIIGGGEQRCSSYSGSRAGRNCSADWETILEQDPAFEGLVHDDISFDPDYVFPDFTYSLTRAHLEDFRQIPQRLFNARRKASLLNHLNQALEGESDKSHLAWTAFTTYLPDATSDGNEPLTLAESAMLRSAFVDPPPNYKRKWQARSTRFSSNAATVAITAAFVAAARTANNGYRPLIGVVTASGGPHPFVDRDINVSAFRSAGAEVVYLPLGGGFRQALDADDCDNLRFYSNHYNNATPERKMYHADLLFPDLARQQHAYCIDNGQSLNATLNRLSGIYFSGGNQVRHLESLVTKNSAGDYSLPSPQQALLQRRHAQGKLVVAGTSAGNHIQGGGAWQGKPVPMVGGGNSYEALTAGFVSGPGANGAGAVRSAIEQNDNISDAAIIYPLGGLGVFQFGVLDSHFSRRVREGRLVRATFDSAMDYGFGVDENTALLVSQPDTTGTTHFSVLGAGGIFIVDVRAARGGSIPPKLFIVEGVQAHYLLPGDTATIDAAGKLQVTLSARTQPLPAADKNKMAFQDRLFDRGTSNFLNLATAMGREGAWLAYGTTHSHTDSRNFQNKPYYSVTLSRGESTVFRSAKSADGKKFGPVSYTGLQVAIAPCDGFCRSPALVDNQVAPKT